jgi:hypothetical protein
MQHSLFHQQALTGSRDSAVDATGDAHSDEFGNTVQHLADILVVDGNMVFGCTIPRERGCPEK